MMTTAETTITKAAGEEWVIFNNLQHGMVHLKISFMCTYGQIDNF